LVAGFYGQQNERNPNRIGIISHLATRICYSTPCLFLIDDHWTCDVGDLYCEEKNGEEHEIPIQNHSMKNIKQLSLRKEESTVV